MATGYTQDFPSLISEATQRASTLASGAGNLASQLPNIGQLLKDRATEAYSSNQDIIQPLDKATATYLTTPQAAREQFQGIFNPFSREKLVAQSVQNAALPMLSLSSILGNRIGRIQDIIGTGTDAFKSQILAEQAEAEAAQSLVTNLLNQYKLESDNSFRERELALKGSEGSGQNGLMADLLAILSGYGGGQGGNGLDDLLEPDVNPTSLSFGGGSPLSLGGGNGLSMGTGAPALTFANNPSVGFDPLTLTLANGLRFGTAGNVGIGRY